MEEQQEGGRTMSEERPQHTQEPAEGSDEDVETAGAQRAAETDEETKGATRTQHTQEPAEGGDEDVDEPGAERAKNKR
jgi:hypothetical protein